MPFTYPTVDVGSNTYNVYGDVDAANDYLAATLTSAGSAWDAADATTKAKALVGGTRWLDAAQWQGAKTDSTQALQWPRTGVLDLDPNSLPANLQYALFELAAALVENANLRAELGQPLPRSLSAGSVNISYFRPNQVNISSFFPPQVMSYVSQWLGGATDMTSGPIVDGVGDWCSPLLGDRPWPRRWADRDRISPLDEDFGLMHGF